MANSIGDMVVRIVGDNSQFDKSIDESEAKIDSFSKTVKGIVGTLGLLTLSKQIIQMGKSAMASVAQMEMLEASFTTMMGSAKKAALLMTDLKNMAAVTPFETTDLAQATKTLLQFGVAGEKIIPTLQMIGDASGGSSSKMGSMALVFGQINSLGRLMGQDLIQLINAGFNPLVEISNKTGESMAVLKDRMSKGGISAIEVADAFKLATSEGGRFYKGMDTASKTLEGLISTLKDDVGALGRSMVEGFLPYMKDFVKSLSSTAKVFTSFNSETKSAILTVLAITASIGPLVVIVNSLSTAFSALKIASAFLMSNPYALAIGAFVTIIAALGIENLKTTAEQKKLNEELQKTIDLSSGVVDDTVKNSAAIAYSKAIATQKVLLEDIAKKEAEIAASRAQVGSTDNQQAINFNRNLIDSYKGMLAVTEKTLPELKQKMEIEKAEQKLLADLAAAEEKRKKDEAERAHLADPATIKAAADMRENLRSSYVLTDSLEDQIERLNIERQKELDLAKEAHVLSGIEIDALNESYNLKIDILKLQMQQLIQEEEVEILNARNAEAEKKSNQKKVESIKKAAADKNKTMRLDNEDSEEAIKLIEFQTQAIIAARTKEGAELRQEKIDYRDFISKNSAGINALKEAEYKSFTQIEEAKSKMMKDFSLNSVEAEKWAASEKLKIISNVMEKTSQVISTTMGLVNNIYKTDLDNKKRAIQEGLDFALEANEQELQSKLKLAGVANKSALETAKINLETAKNGMTVDEIALQEKLRSAGIIEKTDRELAQEALDVAKKSGDESKIKEAQLALDKITITEDFYKAVAIRDAEAAVAKEELIKEYANKEIKIKNDSAAAAYKIELAAFDFNKALAMSTIIIDGAVATIKALAKGDFLGAAGSAVSATLSGIAIGAQKPPSAPSAIPLLAQGGIVMPRVGGTLANIAEAGQPEVVFPLEKLERFLSDGTFGNSSTSSTGEGDIRLIVNLDSKPFLDKIFPATRNRTILISAGAVV